MCVVVQSLNHVLFFVNPWTAPCQTPLSFTTSQSLLRFMSTESVMLSNHLILCHPLLPLPSVIPSIRDFLVSWLFTSDGQSSGASASAAAYNEYSGLISFRIDWFDLLAVQGTVKSLLQSPQFKSISSSAVILLYGPTLTSIHDY